MTEFFVTLILAGAVFVRFKSVAIAFAVAATFSIGAMVGFFLSLLLAGQVFPRPHDDTSNLIYVFIFASAGAIAGAATALTLLRRIAGDKPWWRR